MDGCKMPHIIRDRPTKPRRQVPNKPHVTTKQQPVTKTKSPPTRPSPPHTKLLSNIDVTIVIVNYRTKHLVKNAYMSVRKFYPNILIILVDNGSQDDSTKYVEKLGKKEHTKAVLLPENIGHGPAMHIAIKSLHTKYVLTMDSDCVIKSIGAIEEMVRIADRKGLYAIGWKRWVDKVSGVPKEWHLEKHPGKKFVAYIHPAFGLYNVEKYNQLKPAFHHGAPLLQNMVCANELSMGVESFPVFDYVKHLVAGTRRMYSGHWDPRNKKPNEWKRKADYPI